MKTENAMELAFKKAVIDGINADKQTIKEALFGKKKQSIDSADKEASKPVSKKHESKKTA